jgi:multiple sugar transport system permease protein
MAETLKNTSITLPKKPRFSRLQLREELAGLFFTSPWWIGFLVFSLYPMLAGLYYAFTDARWVGAANWVGLDNFVRALTKDRLFWHSIRITCIYAFTSVPLGLGGSLFAASILNQRLKGENWFRTLFYIPSLMPAVALVVIWSWIFNPTFGLLNYLLGFVGITGIGWLDSTQWAIPALLIMVTWGSFGGTAMLVFLSSLQSVPQELYEVCELDGGNPWHKFLHVTVPMISPAIFFNLFFGIIGAFSSFLYMFLAPDTPGGPNYATHTLGLHIYNKAFVDGEMGFAGAMAWLLFLLVLTVVLLNYKFSGRWVFMASLDEGEL